MRRLPAMQRMRRLPRLHRLQPLLHTPLRQRLLPRLRLRREAPPLEQLHDELYFTGEGVRRRLDGHGQPFVNILSWLVLLRPASPRNVILALVITRTFAISCSEAHTST